MASLPLIHLGSVVNLILGWNKDAHSDQKEVQCPGEIVPSATIVYHRPDGFNNRNLLWYNSAGQKSKIKMSARLASSEAPFLG